MAAHMRLQAHESNEVLRENNLVFIIHEVLEIIL